MTLDTQTQPFRVASAFPSLCAWVLARCSTRWRIRSRPVAYEREWDGSFPASAITILCRPRVVAGRRGAVPSSPASRPHSSGSGHPRSFQKPRGYAGDAELLDLIYGRTTESHLAAESRLGLEIYHFWTAEPERRPSVTAAGPSSRG